MIEREKSEKKKETIYSVFAIYMINGVTNFDKKFMDIICYLVSKVVFA